MATETHNIAAITDVPALVGTFAAANGFDADLTNPNAPIITCPGDSNSVEENLPMQISASIVLNVHSVQWGAPQPDSNSLEDETVAIAISPILGGVDPGHPNVSLPTKLHIFGTAVGTDSPFIACVIEYGFNSYRHLYFGKMEAQGGYTGREVIAGTCGPQSTGAFARDFNDPSSWKYLFGAFSGVLPNNQQGGVRIVHADNATPWRRFKPGNLNTSSPLDEFTGDEVIGGFGDAVNDGYLTRARSAFNGRNPLVPINLYSMEPIVNDVSLVPIGRPPGVRMVHMQDLEPGAEIVVGNETWRVFPVMTKSAALFVTATQSWPTNESSVYVGLAYLEEDAP